LAALLFILAAAYSQEADTEELYRWACRHVPRHFNFDRYAGMTTGDQTLASRSNGMECGTVVELRRDRTGLTLDGYKRNRYSFSDVDVVDWRTRAGPTINTNPTRKAVRACWKSQRKVARADL